MTWTAPAAVSVPTRSPGAPMGRSAMPSPLKSGCLRGVMGCQINCASAGRVGRTVVLRLRFGDFERATRSHTLPFATASTQTILATARALLATATPLIERRGITLIGCAVAMLEDDRTRQLLLGPEEALDAAVDTIRDRFGSAAIVRAVLLGRDPGFSMPLLPD